MFHLVDFLIIAWLVVSFGRGKQIGLVQQVASIGGFLGGLWLGAMLQPHLVTNVNSTLSRVILTLGMTLGLALIGRAVFEEIGQNIKSSEHFKFLDKSDDILGGIAGVFSSLLVVWLVASIILSLPTVGIQDSIRQSAILGYMNRRLPSAPSVLSDIGHLIDPNGFPDVFAGIGPPPSGTVIQPDTAQYSAVVEAVHPSVVRFAGRGCGGIVEGSGFIIAPDLVATNAHVVAGIKDIRVQDQAGNHDGEAIWFNPDLDFAVIRVRGLSGTPLQLESNEQPRATPAIVLGYPGGGRYTASSAAILSTLTAEGYDIYGRNPSTRQIYEIQSNVQPGNSGGPLISTDGKVIGIVFAKAVEYPNIGYALTLDQIQSELKTAQTENRVRSTSQCSE